MILAHPVHIESLAEFDCMILNNEAAILDQLESHQEVGIFDVKWMNSACRREIRSEFWGPPKRGVEILYEHTSCVASQKYPLYTR